MGKGNGPPETLLNGRNTVWLVIHHAILRLSCVGGWFVSGRAEPIQSGAKEAPY